MGDSCLYFGCLIMDLWHDFEVARAASSSQALPTWLIERRPDIWHVVVHVERLFELEQVQIHLFVIFASLLPYRAQI